MIVALAVQNGQLKELKKIVPVLYNRARQQWLKEFTAQPVPNTKPLVHAAALAVIGLTYTHSEHLSTRQGGHLSQAIQRVIVDVLSLKPEVFDNRTSPWADVLPAQGLDILWLQERLLRALKPIYGSERQIRVPDDVAQVYTWLILRTGLPPDDLENSPAIQPSLRHRVVRLPVQMPSLPAGELKGLLDKVHGYVHPTLGFWRSTLDATKLVQLAMSPATVFARNDRGQPSAKAMEVFAEDLLSMIDPAVLPSLEKALLTMVLVQHREKLLAPLGLTLRADPMLTNVLQVFKTALSTTVESSVIPAHHAHVRALGLRLLTDFASHLQSAFKGPQHALIQQLFFPARVLAMDALRLHVAHTHHALTPEVVAQPLVDHVRNMFRNATHDDPQLRRAARMLYQTLSAHRSRLPHVKFSTSVEPQDLRNTAYCETALSQLQLSIELSPLVDHPALEALHELLDGTLDAKFTAESNSADDARRLLLSCKQRSMTILRTALELALSDELAQSNESKELSRSLDDNEPSEVVGPAPSNDQPSQVVAVHAETIDTALHHLLLAEPSDSPRQLAAKEAAILLCAVARCHSELGPPARDRLTSATQRLLDNVEQLQACFCAMGLTPANADMVVEMARLMAALAKLPAVVLSHDTLLHMSDVIMAAASDAPSDPGDALSEDSPNEQIFAHLASALTTVAQQEPKTTWPSAIFVNLYQAAISDEERLLEGWGGSVRSILEAYAQGRPPQGVLQDVIDTTFVDLRGELRTARQEFAASVLESLAGHLAHEQRSHLLTAVCDTTNPLPVHICCNLAPLVVHHACAEGSADCPPLEACLLAARRALGAIIDLAPSMPNEVLCALLRLLNLHDPQPVLSELVGSDGSLLQRATQHVLERFNLAWATREELYKLLASAPCALAMYLSLSPAARQTVLRDLGEQHCPAAFRLFYKCKNGPECPICSTLLTPSLDVATGPDMPSADMDAPSPDPNAELLAAVREVTVRNLRRGWAPAFACVRFAPPAMFSSETTSLAVEVLHHADADSDARKEAVVHAVGLADRLPRLTQRAQALLCMHAEAQQLASQPPAAQASLKKVIRLAAGPPAVPVPIRTQSALLGQLKAHDVRPEFMDLALVLVQGMINGNQGPIAGLLQAVCESTTTTTDERRPRVLKALATACRIGHGIPVKQAVKHLGDSLTPAFIDNEHVFALLRHVLERNLLPKTEALQLAQRAMDVAQQGATPRPGLVADAAAALLIVLPQPAELAQLQPRQLEQLANLVATDTLAPHQTRLLVDLLQQPDAPKLSPQHQALVQARRLQLDFQAAMDRSATDEAETVLAGLLDLVKRQPLPNEEDKNDQNDNPLSRLLATGLLSCVFLPASPLALQDRAWPLLLDHADVRVHILDTAVLLHLLDRGFPPDGKCNMQILRCVFKTQPWLKIKAVEQRLVAELLAQLETNPDPAQRRELSDLLTKLTAQSAEHLASASVETARKAQLLARGTAPDAERVAVQADLLALGLPVPGLGSSIPEELEGMHALLHPMRAAPSVAPKLRPASQWLERLLNAPAQDDHLCQLTHFVFQGPTLRPNLSAILPKAADIAVTALQADTTSAKALAAAAFIVQLALVARNAVDKALVRDALQPLFAQDLVPPGQLEPELMVVYAARCQAWASTLSLPGADTDPATVHVRHWLMTSASLLPDGVNGMLARAQPSERAGIMSAIFLMRAVNDTEFESAIQRITDRQQTLQPLMMLRLALRSVLRRAPGNDAQRRLLARVADQADASKLRLAVQAQIALGMDAGQLTFWLDTPPHSTVYVRTLLAAPRPTEFLDRLLQAQLVARLVQFAPTLARSKVLALLPGLHKLAVDLSTAKDHTGIFAFLLHHEKRIPPGCPPSAVVAGWHRLAGHVPVMIERLASAGTSLAAYLVTLKDLFENPEHVTIEGLVQKVEVLVLLDMLMPQLHAPHPETSAETDQLLSETKTALVGAPRAQLLHRLLEAGLPFDLLRKMATVAVRVPSFSPLSLSKRPSLGNQAPTGPGQPPHPPEPGEQHCEDVWEALDMIEATRMPVTVACSELHRLLDLDGQCSAPAPPQEWPSRLLLAAPGLRDPVHQSDFTPEELLLELEKTPGWAWAHADERRQWLALLASIEVHGSGRLATQLAEESSSSMTIQEFTKGRIGSWARRFVKLAADNSTDLASAESTMAWLMANEMAWARELVAVLQRAVWLYTESMRGEDQGYELRHTQLLALLLSLRPQATPECQGWILQMDTGQGKSLTIAVRAIVACLLHPARPVDVATSQYLLAKRDAEELGPLYKLFGIKARHNHDPEYVRGPKSCYRADERPIKYAVCYGAVSDFQFDHLHDVFYGRQTRAGRPFGLLIVDECDYSMLDNAAHIAKLAAPLPGMDALLPVHALLSRHARDLCAAHRQLTAAVAAAGDERQARQLAVQRVRQSLPPLYWACFDTFTSADCDQVLPLRCTQDNVPYEAIKLLLTALLSPGQSTTADGSVSLGLLDFGHQQVQGPSAAAVFAQGQTALQTAWERSSELRSDAARKARHLFAKGRGLFGSLIARVQTARGLAPEITGDPLAEDEHDQPTPEATTDDIEIVPEEFVIFDTEAMQRLHAFLEDPRTMANELRLDEQHEVKRVRLPTYLLPLVLQQREQYIENALRAEYEFEDKREYVLGSDDSGRTVIKPVDFRGNGLVQNRMTWSHGLHQMLQFKEGVPVSVESLTTNFFSNVAYFRGYQELVGLTGTVDNVAKPFKDIYNVHTQIVPRHRPRAYLEYPTRLCGNTEVWLFAVLRSALREALVLRRPCLVFCESIDHAELIHALLLMYQAGDVPSTFRTHQTPEERAALIAQLRHICKLLPAAQRTPDARCQVHPELVSRDDVDDMNAVNKTRLKSGDIVVTTSLLGRGADLALTAEAERAGGLHAILTSLAANRRVERQARGRVARGNAPGTAEMLLNLPVYNTPLCFADAELQKLMAQRDTAEREAFDNFTKQQLPCILRKENAFAQFCLMLPDLERETPGWTLDDPHRALRHWAIKTLQRKYVDMLRTDLTEAWGVWLLQHEATMQESDQAVQDALATFRANTAAQSSKPSELRGLNNPCNRLQFANEIVALLNRPKFRLLNVELVTNLRRRLLQHLDEQCALASTAEPLLEGAALGLRAYAALMNKTKRDDPSQRQEAGEMFLLANKHIEEVTMPQLQMVAELSRQTGNRETLSPLCASLNNKLTLCRMVVHMHNMAAKVVKTTNKMVTVHSAPDEQDESPETMRIDQLATWASTNCRSRIETQADERLPVMLSPLRQVERVRFDSLVFAYDTKRAIREDPLVVLDANHLPDAARATVVIEGLEASTIAEPFDGKLSMYNTRVSMAVPEMPLPSAVAVLKQMSSSPAASLAEVCVPGLTVETRNALAAAHAGHQQLEALIEDRQQRGEPTFTLDTKREVLVMTGVSVADTCEALESLHEWFVGVEGGAGTTAALGVRLTFAQMPCAEVCRRLPGPVKVRFGHVDGANARDFIRLMQQHYRGLVDAYALEMTYAGASSEDVAAHLEHVGGTVMPMDLREPQVRPLTSLANTVAYASELPDLQRVGFQYVIELRARPPLPWVTVAILGSIAAVQLGLGLALAVGFGWTGIGAAMGVALMCESINEVIDMGRASFYRNFSWSQYLAMKAVSLAVSALTAGLSGLQTAGRELGEAATRGVAEMAVTYTAKKGSRTLATQLLLHSTRVGATLVGTLVAQSIEQAVTPAQLLAYERHVRRIADRYVHERFEAWRPRLLHIMAAGGVLSSTTRQAKGHQQVFGRLRLDVDQSVQNHQGTVTRNLHKDSSDGDITQALKDLLDFVYQDVVEAHWRGGTLLAVLQRHDTVRATRSQAEDICAELRRRGLLADTNTLLVSEMPSQLHELGQGVNNWPATVASLRSPACTVMRQAYAEIQAIKAAEEQGAACGWLTRLENHLSRQVAATVLRTLNQGFQAFAMKLVQMPRGLAPRLTASAAGLNAVVNMTPEGKLFLALNAAQLLRPKPGGLSDWDAVLALPPLEDCLFGPGEALGDASELDLEAALGPTIAKNLDRAAQAEAGEAMIGVANAMTRRWNPLLLLRVAEAVARCWWNQARLEIGLKRLADINELQLILDDPRRWSDMFALMVAAFDAVHMNVSTFVQGRHRGWIGLTHGCLTLKLTCLQVKSMWQEALAYLNGNGQQRANLPPVVFPDLDESCPDGLRQMMELAQVWVLVQQRMSIGTPAEHWERWYRVLLGTLQQFKPDHWEALGGALNPVVQTVTSRPFGMALRPVLQQLLWLDSALVRRHGISDPRGTLPLVHALMHLLQTVAHPDGPPLCESLAALLEAIPVEPLSSLLPSPAMLNLPAGVDGVAVVAAAVIVIERVARPVVVALVRRCPELHALMGTILAVQAREVPWTVAAVEAVELFDALIAALEDASANDPAERFKVMIAASTLLANTVLCCVPGVGERGNYAQLVGPLAELVAAWLYLALAGILAVRQAHDTLTGTGPNHTELVRALQALVGDAWAALGPAHTGALRRLIRQAWPALPELPLGLLELKGDWPPAFWQHLQDLAAAGLSGQPPEVVHQVLLLLASHPAFAPVLAQHGGALARVLDAQALLPVPLAPVAQALLTHGDTVRGMLIEAAGIVHAAQGRRWLRLSGGLVRALGLTTYYDCVLLLRRSSSTPERAQALLRLLWPGLLVGVLKTVGWSLIRHRRPVGRGMYFVAHRSAAATARATQLVLGWLALRGPERWAPHMARLAQALAGRQPAPEAAGTAAEQNIETDETHESFEDGRFEDEKWAAREVKNSLFVRCLFTNVDWTGSRLRNVEFRKCTFGPNGLCRSAVLQAGVSFFNCTFEASDLSPSLLAALRTGAATWQVPELCGSLAGTDLRDISLDGAIFSQVTSMDGAWVQGTSFSNIVVRPATRLDELLTEACGVPSTPVFSSERQREHAARCLRRVLQRCRGQYGLTREDLHFVHDDLVAELETDAALCTFVLHKTASPEGNRDLASRLSAGDLSDMRGRLRALFRQSRILAALARDFAGATLHRQSLPALQDWMATNHDMDPANVAQVVAAAATETWTSAFKRPACPVLRLRPALLTANRHVTSADWAKRLESGRTTVSRATTAACLVLTIAALLMLLWLIRALFI